MKRILRKGPISLKALVEMPKEECSVVKSAGLSGLRSCIITNVCVAPRKL